MTMRLASWFNRAPEQAPLASLPPMGVRRRRRLKSAVERQTLARFGAPYWFAGSQLTKDLRIGHRKNAAGTSYLRLVFQYTFERPAPPGYTLPEGLMVAVGPYHYEEAAIELRGSRNRPITGDLTIGGGECFVGND